MAASSKAAVVGFPSVKERCSGLRRRGLIRGLYSRRARWRGDWLGFLPCLVGGLRVTDWNILAILEVGDSEGGVGAADIEEVVSAEFIFVRDWEREKVGKDEGRQDGVVDGVVDGVEGLWGGGG